jgi:hypothetical protein
MAIIPALERLRQGVLEFKASLGYIARSCLKNKHKQTTKRDLLKISHFPL